MLTLNDRDDIKKILCTQYQSTKLFFYHEWYSKHKDNRSKGNNRKLVIETEGFLKVYMISRPGAVLSELQDLL